MKYNTQHLLDWFREIPYIDIAKIFPHSRLLELEDTEEELEHLEEVWCRKSIEERDIIKENILKKEWKDLSWNTQEKLEQDYILTNSKEDIFIDGDKRPYLQTPNGKLYFSSKKSYEYSFKN